MDCFRQDKTKASRNKAMQSVHDGEVRARKDIKDEKTKQMGLKTFTTVRGSSGSLVMRLVALVVSFSLAL